MNRIESFEPRRPLLCMTHPSASAITPLLHRYLRVTHGHRAQAAATSAAHWSWSGPPPPFSSLRAHRLSKPPPFHTVAPAIFKSSVATMPRFVALTPAAPSKEEVLPPPQSSLPLALGTNCRQNPPSESPVLKPPPIPFLGEHCHQLLLVSILPSLILLSTFRCCRTLPPPPRIAGSATTAETSPLEASAPWIPLLSEIPSPRPCPAPHPSHPHAR
jgi:hypothetical protein